MIMRFNKFLLIFFKLKSIFIINIFNETFFFCRFFWGGGTLARVPAGVLHAGQRPAANIGCRLPALKLGAEEEEGEEHQTQ